MENKQKTCEKRAVKRNAKPSTPSVESKKIKTDSTNVLNLNDECWLSVFRYMRIRDIVNAEKTCKHLRNLAKLHYTTVKTLKWTPDLPFAAASQIICKFGRFSTSLHSMHFYRVRRPNDIDGTHAYQHFINTLLHICRNIKALTFTKCDVSGEWAPFFDALLNLESLSLVNSRFRNSNYMRRLNTLQRLQLVGDSSFKPADFNDFLLNNRRLMQLVIEDCEELSAELSYHNLAYLPHLECLAVEVYPENVEELLADLFDDENGVAKCFKHLKRLKVTQAEPDLNLNRFLRKISENATALDELDLFKVEVDGATLATMKAMKLKTLKLYPRINDSVTTFCGMLADAMSDLRDLTLVLFDPDQDTDLSDGDLLLLIERMRRLESLNVHYCECECDCDYVICPFRCKLRRFIDSLNDIFQCSAERPSFKVMLPKRMSQSYFHGNEKLQKKYRQILTDRVQFIRSNELDFSDTTTGYSRSIFIDFLESMPTLSDLDVSSGSEVSMTSNVDSVSEDGAGSIISISISELSFDDPKSDDKVQDEEEEEGDDFVKKLFF